MIININIKQLSKKGRKVKPLPFIYEKNPGTVEEFIKATVDIMYRGYLEKLEKNQDIGSVYSKEHIEEMAEMGKVAFGFVYDDRVPDLEKAYETALLAYKDGIVRLFVGEQEAGALNDKINLKENDEVTFIRLAMLAGRMW